MTTFYSFHRAADMAMIETALVADLQTVAAHVAKRVAPHNDNTSRVFIHNGLGVVCAGLCRGGVWHDMPHDDFSKLDDAARAEREAFGLPNDPKRSA